MLLLVTSSYVMASPVLYRQDKDKDKEDGKELVLPEFHGLKKRLAVAPMDIPATELSSWTSYFHSVDNSHDVYTVQDVGNKLTAMLTTALQSTNRFRILERQDVGDIKSEIALTGDLGNDKTAIKKGGLLGAQIMVRCSVTEFQPHAKSDASGINLGVVSFGGGGNESKVVVDVKGFDTTTSEILFSDKATGLSKSKGSVVGINLGGISAGSGHTTSDPIELATRHAIENAVYKICMKMKNTPWEGKVIVASGSSIFINCGSIDGVKVGDTFNVYQGGQQLKDPDTGESLGRAPDTLAGTVEVTAVSEKNCQVSYTGSTPLQAGFIVKEKQVDPAPTESAQPAGN
jgi:curli biogenesis system outer membrane secretion channel CsgG